MSDVIHRLLLYSYRTAPGLYIFSNVDSYIIIIIIITRAPVFIIVHFLFILS